LRPDLIHFKFPPQVAKATAGEVKKLPCSRQLQTLPGVGSILALTITLETGDITRFRSAGDYDSYRRTVDSARLSNEPCRESAEGWTRPTRVRELWFFETE